MTFTSVSCASGTVIWHARSGGARISHTRKERSTDAEQNTVASVGDHCRSSTEAVCAEKGAGDTAQEPACGRNFDSEVYFFISYSYSLLIYE